MWDRLRGTYRTVQADAASRTVALVEAGRGVGDDRQQAIWALVKCDRGGQRSDPSWALSRRARFTATTRTGAYSSRTTITACVAPLMHRWLCTWMIPAHPSCIAVQNELNYSIIYSILPSILGITIGSSRIPSRPCHETIVNLKAGG